MQLKYGTIEYLAFVGREPPEQDLQACRDHLAKCWPNADHRRKKRERRKFFSKVFGFSKKDAATIGD